MRYLSVLISLPYFLAPQPAMSKPVWDVTTPGACSYNQTLGSGIKCQPFDYQQIFDSPLKAYGNTIPPFFGYSLSFRFIFTCKREVGLNPLTAEILVSDKRTNSELSKIKVSPTTSVEERRVSIRLNKDGIKTEVRILPSLTSSFYSPCYFEILEPVLTPEFEPLEWYADYLIESRSFSQKVEETLVEALTKPAGWERAEQLGGDLEEYLGVKKMECSRNIRKLARKLKLDSSSLTTEDSNQILELSGFEPAAFPITHEQLNDPESICGGITELQISGKIGSLIEDIANLEEARDKALVFSTLDECLSEISQICRTKVENFRTETLSQIKSQQKSLENKFLDYLTFESNRLAVSQSELSSRVKGLLDEVRK